MKAFQKSLKQDMELMKQSVEMLPKEMRKDAFKQRKEEKEAEQNAARIALDMLSF